MSECKPPPQEPMPDRESGLQVISPGNQQQVPRAQISAKETTESGSAEAGTIYHDQY